VVEADAYLRGYAVGKSVYWRFCESTVPPFAWSEFVQRLAPAAIGSVVMFVGIVSAWTAWSQGSQVASADVALLYSKNMSAVQPRAGLCYWAAGRLE
jgi:hypothetical protein